MTAEDKASPFTISIPKKPRQTFTGKTMRESTAQTEHFFTAGLKKANGFSSVNAESSGEFEFVAKVASETDGAAFSLQIDDSEIAHVAVPNTGSFTNFTEVTGKTSQISKGEHLLKLFVEEPYFNVDYLAFTANDTEKISVPNKRKSASSYRIYDMNGKKFGSYFTNSGEKNAFKNLQDKYPQGPYRYRRSAP